MGDTTQLAQVPTQGEETNNQNDDENVSDKSESL
jgi:hypothetical protein